MSGYKNFEEFENKNYLDLEKTFLALVRNKKIIGIFLLLGLAIGGITIISQKRISEGKLQIVLSEQDGNNLNFNNAIPREFSNVLERSNRKKIRTEVEILKSPSVLMSIFEYVKNKKGEDFKNLRFDKWFKDNLSIKLQKGTTILEIIYRDSEKDLIIPVLNKIALKYKDYSGKEKRINNYDTDIYLKKKLKEYELASNNALKALRDFGEENDLFTISDTKNKNSFNQISVEKKIDKNKSEIISINENLLIIKKILEKKDFYEMEAFLRLANRESNFFNTNYFKVLDEIDQKILKRRQNYKENDAILKNLIKGKHSFLEDSLNKLSSILKSEKEKSYAIINSSKRPKEIIDQYRILQLDATNKSAAYAALQKEKVRFDILSSKTKRSWELITEPTLTPFYVQPKKKRTLAISSILSIFIGSIFALYKDQKRGIIYDIEELKIKLPFKYLYTFNREEKDYWENYLKAIFKKILLNSQDESFILLNFLKASQENTDLIKDIILREFSTIKIEVNNDLKYISGSDKVILCFSLGELSNIEIDNLIEKINILNLDIIGWILIK